MDDPVAREIVEEAEEMGASVEILYNDFTFRMCRFVGRSLRDKVEII